MRTTRFSIIVIWLIILSGNAFPSEIPVYLNGFQLQEDFLGRDWETGEVTSVNINSVSGIPDNAIDSNCLEEINEHGKTIQHIRIAHYDLKTIDLEPLTYFNSLMSLELDGISLERIDLSPLQNCSSLVSLIITRNPLKEIDLSPLSCINVELLDLQRNDLQHIDLKPLQKCTNLVTLKLSSNSLTEIDLSPLSNFTSLVVIDLGDNGLTEIDLNPLNSCSSLVNISLKKNNLTKIDLSSLKSISLRELDLIGNNLDDTTCNEIYEFEKNSNFSISDNCYAKYEGACLDYYPSTEEFRVLDFLNYARVNPKEYAAKYLKERYNEAYQDMVKRTPLEPLAMDLLLSRAACIHCEASGPEGIIGHEDKWGRPASRCSKMKYGTNVGECCSYGHYSAEDIVNQLIVDTGIPERGHRNMIMSSKYKAVGISIGRHSKYGYMCTLDFGTKIKLPIEREE